MRASSLAPLLVLTGCSSALVDLSPFSVNTWPSQPNQVLAATDTVRVTFSSAVDRTTAQSLLTISSVDGVASGDLTWSGNTLSFTPVPALAPSKRYNLEYSGQVPLADGRRFNIVKEVPFFSENASPGLLLTSYRPASGATASLTSPLILSFNQAVDPESVIQGFSVSPTAVYTVVWSPDAKTVTVTPQTWPSSTVVSWRLSASVKSALGLPLVSSVSRTFITNADQDPPGIVSLVPAVAIGTGVVTWSAVSTSLNDLQNGDALLLTMSEPVSLPSLAGALHFTPSIKGHWDTQSDVAPKYEYVFVPEDDWTSGTEYSLQLSGVQDLAGNSLLASFLATFTPAVPRLTVTGVTLTGTSATVYEISDLNKVNFFPACAPSGVSGALQIAVTLAFSQPFSASDKVQFAQLSFCEPIFPNEGSTLAKPSLVTVSFSSDSTAVLTYQGFSVGTASTPDYYRVRVPGGPAGLKTRAGSILKEDVWLNFTTGS